MHEKYSIGLDFGTLSARAILVDVKTGEEIAISVFGYQDAVIDKYLPGTSIKIPPEFALQNPRDYMEALECLLRDIWRKGGIKPEQVVGIGVDFTSCTMLPVDEKYLPLCFNPTFKESIHSWAKLWKHHGAQAEANHINATAKMRFEEFIKRYGNKSSSEWMFAKILETLNHEPKVYQNAFRFIEGCDWMVYLMTGKDCRNSCLAGYKSFWNKKEGYPSEDFFEAVDPRLRNVVNEKIGTEVYSVGDKAGELTEEMAKKTGLIPGTAVGVGNTDAHLAVPAVGITEPGDMALIMGTSLCHMMVANKEVKMEGICGVVEDGILPGFFGYEAGQPAVGDIYDWFVSNLAPYEYVCEALEKNITIFDVMNEKAAKIKPGCSGLLALDWWNGNRSILVDADLSGLIIGLTLKTKPEEVYRAIIESTAFGTRLIVENFINNGVQINNLYACGGLSRKSKTVMQIFSDVLGMEIKVSASHQTSALGAAMYGAVAAGAQRGGHNSIFEAAVAMSHIHPETYKPNMNNFRIYSRIFEEYKKLHDVFGRNGLDVMKVLKGIKNAEEISS
jgi:L-ribulokinase